MNTQAIDLDEVRSEYEGFPGSFNSTLLGTVGRDGVPHASYAAYVHFEHNYYVYVSELARHTQNLTETGKASLLFIENEADAGHLFARRRVTYDCDAQEITRDSTEFNNILDLFEKKFGEFMQNLKTLKDFHLFRISPKQGTFVKGFARAFAIGGEGMQELRHMNDTGHRREK